MSKRMDSCCWVIGDVQVTDFGGLNEKAWESKLLATASVWESRAPLVLARHWVRKGMPSVEEIGASLELMAELIEAVRFELAQREQFKASPLCGQE